MPDNSLMNSENFRKTLKILEKTWKFLGITRKILGKTLKILRKPLVSYSQTEPRFYCLVWFDLLSISYPIKRLFLPSSDNFFSQKQVSMESDKNGVTTWRTQSVHGNHHHRSNHQQHAHISTHSTNNVLRARRGVVRMLMVVVLTFALCNLPLHARKMWQYW